MGSTRDASVAAPLRVKQPSLQSICVFCGSNGGTRSDYLRIAGSVGTRLAQRGIRIVYGGGSCGLMGAVADAALAAGGCVVGVIPHAIERRELAHRGVSELQIVGSMHERKAKMNEQSDAFLALPGGLGTYEELFEVLSWAQLGIHRKPVAILNVAGYFDPLLEMLDHALAEKFLRPEHRALLLHGDEIDELLSRMAAYEAPIAEKWLDVEQV
jgi:uncharacterized protein (TIGR00730 family)